MVLRRCGSSFPSAPVSLYRKSNHKFRLSHEFCKRLGGLQRPGRRRARGGAEGVRRLPQAHRAQIRGARGEAAAKPQPQEVHALAHASLTKIPANVLRRRYPSRNPRRRSDAVNLSDRIPVPRLRQIQALSANTRRTRASPVLAMPPRRALGGHEAETGHRSPWVFEPADVAGLRHESDRGDQRTPRRVPVLPPFPKPAAPGRTAHAVGMSLAPFLPQQNQRSRVCATERRARPQWVAIARALRPSSK